MVGRVCSFTLLILLLAFVNRTAALERYNETELQPQDRQHWSFQSPVRPDLPATKFPTLTPVDHFIRARLEKEGLKPAPAADKLTLLRRVTLDLTGLPPTPAEQDAFLIRRIEPTPTRTPRRSITRLPPLSENVGRQVWMDMYSATRKANGFEMPTPSDPNAWRFRDYVIQSA